MELYNPGAILYSGQHSQAAGRHRGTGGAIQHMCNEQPDSKVMALRTWLGGRRQMKPVVQALAWATGGGTHLMPHVLLVEADQERDVPLGALHS